MHPKLTLSTCFAGGTDFFQSFFLWKSLSTDFGSAIAQPWGTASPCTRSHKGLSVVAGMGATGEWAPSPQPWLPRCSCYEGNEPPEGGGVNH